MNRFKVSTKTSLFKPVEIEVDEKVFSLPMITPALIDEVSKHQEKAEAGDMRATCMQLHLLTGVPVKLAMRLDVRDLEKMMKYVSAKIFKAEGTEEEEEKKESRVGETPSKESKAPIPASSDTKNSSN